MAKRRVILTNEKGEMIGAGDGEHWEIDASGCRYNTAQQGVYAEVQETCNLGHWHTRQRVVFAPWGDD